MTCHLFSLIKAVFIESNRKIGWYVISRGIAKKCRAESIGTNIIRIIVKYFGKTQNCMNTSCNATSADLKSNFPLCVYNNWYLS